MRNFICFITTILLLSEVTFAHSPQPCFVNNPSFEVASKNDCPQGWKVSDDGKIFKIDSTVSRSGNASLCWNGDGKEYHLCTQVVDLLPNDSFIFSAWIKTQNLSGGSPLLCVEWKDHKGKWLGGVYNSAPTIKDGEWTKFECRGIVPAGASNPHITCYASKGTSGVIWFDDVEVSTVLPPILTTATTNLYRNQSIGGNVDVYVGYSPELTDVNFAELNPVVNVVNSNGQTIKSCASEIGYDFFKFSFDSTDLPVAKYTLICKAIDPRSKDEIEVSIPYERLDTFPERVSYIDEHKRLIHNGKPFFPLGLYLGGVSQSAIDNIGNSPFNCVMPYAQISPEDIGKLYERGVHTIYSVKDEFEAIRGISQEECDLRVKRHVARVKDCPGIIAWYINDELPSTLVDQLTARRDLMQELDPGRPTWIVLYQVDEYRTYLNTYDVAGSDPYPIPEKPVSLAADWTRKTNQAGFGVRAVWQVPQIFNWASYREEAEQTKYRAPTYEEMRSMSWQCIAEGANGLIYYSYFDLERMSKSVAEGGRAVTLEPFDKRWREVKKVAQEIIDQFDILTSVEPPLEIYPILRSDVASIRYFGTSAGTWILVVNKTNEPTTVRFGIPEDAKIVETRLGADAKQDNSHITVELGPMEPRLVLIKRTLER